MNAPLNRLRHHVTGAITRGAAVPITEMPVGITLDAHTLAEWGRMAQAIATTSPDAWRVYAYACNRFRTGDRVSVRYYDVLQSAYRAWLVFNELPDATFTARANGSL